MSQAESAPSSSPASLAAGGQSGNALPIGHRLHEYEITGLVGEGGFGIVYLARDLQLQRTVAIKEYMPASLAMRGNDLTVSVRSERHRETFNLGLRSFVNEARLLASFDHPALIKVYRFWEDSGTAYMVMPFYQGPTLKTWLREQTQAPDEAWLKGMLHPLLDALDAIHADHCYHRDIAPDNILLLGPNKPLLLDFGAARRVIGDATQALTVILKPGYAPVEQYAEVPSMKQGPWTDVYALCAVLYASIMGKAPPPSVGRMMKDDLVPLVQSAAGRYSLPFLAAIDAGLTVHPDHRLQNVAALRERLFATELPPGFVVPPPSSQDDERTVLMPAGEAAPATTFPATQLASPPASAGQATRMAGQPQLGDEPRFAPPPRQDERGVGHVANSQPSNQSASGDAPVKASRAKLWIALAALGVAGGAGAWFLMGRPAHEGGTANVVQGASEAQPTLASQESSAPSASTAGRDAHLAQATQSSGATASAADATLPARRVPFTVAAALEDIVRQADPLLSVNAMTDKSQLVIGKDKLLFKVKSSVPGYLYVYLAGTDENHFYLLFPNGLDSRNRIEADTLIELPRKGWHITAGGPAGVDHIAAVVSPYPRDLQKLGLNMKDAIPEFDMAQAAKLWDAHTGPASPFVPPAICPPGSAPCDQRYGATLIHIEEVATR